MPAHHITTQYITACCSDGFEIAALRASKSAPLMGNMPAHHVTACGTIACCNSWFEVAGFCSRVTNCDPMQDMSCDPRVICERSMRGL